MDRTDTAPFPELAPREAVDISYAALHRSRGEAPASMIPRLAERFQTTQAATMMAMAAVGARELCGCSIEEAAAAAREAAEETLDDPAFKEAVFEAVWETLRPRG